MKKLFFSRQFLLFLLTGGFAALVNFSSRILYSQVMSFSSAVLVAYVTGMVTAFLLFRAFVFDRSARSTFQSVVFFTLVNLLAVVQTWLVSMGMAYYLLPQTGIDTYTEEFAHLAGIAVPVFTSFIGHKYLSFRQHV